MDILLIFRAILGYILIFFVPGYAMVWALYPERWELPFIERIALAMVLSIAGTMISILFMDVYLGVDLTPVTITVMLLIVTAVATLIWGIRVLYNRSRLKKWIGRKFHVPKGSAGGKAAEPVEEN